MKSHLQIYAYIELCNNFVFLLSEFSPKKPLYVNVPSHQTVEIQLNYCDSDINMNNKSVQTGQQKKRSYVSQSAIALRSRVTPPPCIRNPYMKETSSKVLDIFGDRRFKSTGSPSLGFWFWISISLGVSFISYVCNFHFHKNRMFVLCCEFHWSIISIVGI